MSATGGARARRAAPLLAAALLAAALAAPAAARAQGVPTAAHALARGHVLTAEDIAYAPAAGARAAVAAGQAPPAAGWVTRRMIAAGEPLRAPAIAPPEAIRSGQPVDVVWSDGAVHLRLKGTAMNAAPVGGRVTVRIDARRRLEGVAAGSGTVRLD